MKTFSAFITEMKISLRCHDRLNPKLWNEDKSLKPEVRSKLLEFINTWREYARIPENLVQDIVIIGGNTNYNYTRYSDIDVHLVIDRNRINPDRELVDDYLQAKKLLWSASHNIKVYGYPLEPYAQDVTQTFAKGQGAYSIKNNKWIQEPEECDYDFKNDQHLKDKVQYYMDTIDDMIDSKMGVEVFDMMNRKFGEMRRAGIQKYGEFSFENLVFKELRNRGYLNKMNKYSKDIKDSKLSLK
jgi:hypothetical protein